MGSVLCAAIRKAFFVPINSNRRTICVQMKAEEWGGFFFLTSSFFSRKA